MTHTTPTPAPGGVPLAIALLTASMLTAAALAAPADSAPGPEEMWRVIQAQQRQIEQLQAQLAATRSAASEAAQVAQSADSKAEATADLVETRVAATPAGWWDRTALGGYGELHYGNFDDTDEVDFHRFVLYASHRFSERLRFFSELELEHALVEDSDDGSGPGEIELEQAWIEYDLNEHHRLRAGLDVLPIGIVNVTHEPNTFFGVERNLVEREIIPTTWWEAGVAVSGELAPGWNYDLVGHSGLDTPVTGSSAYRIRSGRGEVAEAPADDGAVTGRLRYTGYPGLELGVSAQYQSDLTQGGDGIDIDATLVEAHLIYRGERFGLRALGARWDLDDGPVGVGPAAFGRDEQYGFYVEPAIYLPAPVRGKLGLFGRYSYVDSFAGTHADTDIQSVNAGFNYWPHPDVVLKLDIQETLHSARDDGFSLGLGYAF